MPIEIRQTGVGPKNYRAMNKAKKNALKKSIQKQMPVGTASYKKSAYDDGKRVVNTSKGPIITNLTANKNKGGKISSYYKAGGNVITGRG